MYVKDGQLFDIYTINVIGDFQYAPGHFDDPEERALHGVYAVSNPFPPVAPAGKKAITDGFTENEGVWSAVWVFRDKTPEELEAEKPFTPGTVTRRQARQALLIRGLLDQILPAIATLDDGTPEGLQRKRLAEIEWEDSLNFERHRPLVVQIGLALGLDSEGLDELFRFAATL